MGKQSGGEDERGRLRNAVLIAGPTASGKSALALRIAEERSGVIVNTDSMQGYAILNVLTARPTPEDMQRVPHLLYGHIDPATPYSTGMWLRDVMRQIDTGAFDGRVPVFVGGTGLYFRALLGGLSEMPDIEPHMRDRWRYRLAEEGAQRLHRLLTREDPEVAARLLPSDGQRVARALEVLESTGKSIRHWQAVTGRPLVDAGTAEMMVIDVDRQALVARIDRRFDAMVAAGALEEVRRLMQRGLDSSLPAMKAIGVRELAGADRGEIAFDRAIVLARVATRQYAKRQATWFRNQLGPSWRRISA